MTADEITVRLWLHGKPATTAEAYRRDVQAYLARGRSLADTKLADLGFTMEQIRNYQPDEDQKDPSV